MNEPTLRELTGRYRNALLGFLTRVHKAEAEGCSSNIAEEPLVRREWERLGAASRELYDLVEKEYGYELPISPVDGEPLEDYMEESESATDGQRLSDPEILLITFHSSGSDIVWHRLVETIIEKPEQILSGIEKLAEEVSPVRFAGIYALKQEGRQELAEAQLRAR
jgi:hypothetical protein